MRDWVYLYIERSCGVTQAIPNASMATKVSQDVAEKVLMRWAVALRSDPKAVVQMVLVEDEPDPWGLSA